MSITTAVCDTFTRELVNSAIGHFTSDIYKLALIKPASVGAHGHRIGQRHRERTYNSDQTNTAVTVAAGEEWRVFQLTQQATRDVKFKLSLES